MLDGPGFAAAGLHPAVLDFYEHTAAWRMEAWAEWSFPFGAPGALVNRWFGSRVQQLALPARPLEVAGGIDSTVDVLRDAGGARRGVVWTRVLRANVAHDNAACPQSGSMRSAASTIASKSFSPMASLRRVPVGVPADSAALRDEQQAVDSVE